MKPIIRATIFALIVIAIGYATRNIDDFLIQTFVTGFAIYLVSIFILGKSIARTGFFITATIFILLNLANMLNIIPPR